MGNKRAIGHHTFAVQNKEPKWRKQKEEETFNFHMVQVSQIVCNVCSNSPVSHGLFELDARVYKLLVETNLEATIIPIHIYRHTRTQPHSAISNIFIVYFHIVIVAGLLLFCHAGQHECACIHFSLIRFFHSSNSNYVFNNNNHFVVVI